MTAHPVARYVPLLIEGDAVGLRELFQGAPRVNDPFLGWVEDARFNQFVANSYQGLLERNATVEHVATTATAGGGATEECVLRLQRHGNTTFLPVAVSSDAALEAPLESIRIYHSMWPLLGFHLVRPPILPIAPGLALPDVVARYHDCLTRGDAPGIVEQFAPSGGVRGAAGASDVHRGPTALLRFFNVLFANGGGVGVEHCTIADEDGSCALEYVVTSWGRSVLPHQAAAAVYERADTGLLAEVRMYDDVEHPHQQN